MIWLAGAARRIATAVGDRGQAYRVGWDEFMVLLTLGVTVDLATSTGNTIVDAMTAPMRAASAVDLGEHQRTPLDGP